MTRATGGAAAPPDQPSGNAAGGTLYVVATPIGNLGDVTFRGIDTLRAVPLIACEDTRVTRRLLERYDIKARLVSFHARSGPGRLAEVLDHLRSGADLALTTDAGTPGVSDPGEELVAAWAAEQGRVVPIPGASAVIAAVAASGIAGPRWTFEGFLPRSGRGRRERLARIASDDRGCVVYEATNRLAATLRDLASACGDERPGAVCRELTKVHEQIARGSLASLVTAAEAGTIPPRGEVAIVVGSLRDGPRGASPASGAADDGIEAALASVERLVARGTSRGEAVRIVAAQTGIGRRQLYRPTRG